VFQIHRRPAYDAAMSGIGAVADDDVAGWVLKSPDIGTGQTCKITL
jgi:hypothetical protein